MDHSLSPKPDRKRAISEAVAVNRQARAAMSEFSDKLGSLQTEAAYIEAILRRSPNEAVARERQQHLRATLNDEHSRLLAIVGALPPNLQQHSRVIDIVRAFERLTERLPDMAPD